MISLAIISHHHNGLYDIISPDGKDVFEVRINPKREIFYDEVLKKIAHDKEILSDDFDSAATEIENIFNKLAKLYPNDKASLVFSLGLIVRYLLSCVLDADRYDSYLFENNEKVTNMTDDNFFAKLSDELENHIRKLDKSGSVNKERQKISDACLSFAKNDNGIYQLHVPTGGGKTLSSLRYAVNCAKMNGKDRIFYIAPYKSILEQNADVVRGISKYCKEEILEHHSDIVSSDDRYKLLTERWSSKIVLTTMVQFLDTLFAGKSSAARRFHSLANSVIIIDEVQSIPVNCIYMFNTAMNFLASVMNCSVVLCTATQPRLHLTKKYPLMLSNKRMIEDTTEIFKRFKRTQIRDLTIEGVFSSERLAEFIAEKHKDNKRILAILNTKKAALKAFLCLKENYPSFNVCYLSTGLCPAHRRKVLEKIRYEKEVICISTQLIEAGVDISFSIVIRSLAGLDSIAQAAGRCNRNKELENGDVYIIRFKEENIDKLVDIREGQKAALNVLAAFEKNLKDLTTIYYRLRQWTVFITITIHSAKLTMKWAGRKN